MPTGDNRAIEGPWEQIESLRADLNDVRERLAQVEAAASRPGGGQLLLGQAGKRDPECW
jgi:hypothetical protein